jgi:hypothetical protein
LGLGDSDQSTSQPRGRFDFADLVERRNLLAQQIHLPISRNRDLASASRRCRCAETLDLLMSEYTDNVGWNTRDVAPGYGGALKWSALELCL